MTKVMKLKTFEDAFELAGDVPAIANDDYGDFGFFGLSKNSVPWGQKVIVDPDILSCEEYEMVPCYLIDNFFVPQFCFDEAEPVSEDVLRYGTILTDDQVYDRCDDMASCVRIRTVAYEGKIYYIKMVNGEVVEFKKVGVVG